MTAIELALTAAALAIVPMDDVTAVAVAVTAVALAMAVAWWVVARRILAAVPTSEASV